jgi:hypothetical protein
MWAVELPEEASLTAAKIYECMLARVKSANNRTEPLEPGSFRPVKRRINVH